MSRKKHIKEMKETLDQRLVELEAYEQELIQHVRNISQETTSLVRGLMKENDKKKFLKLFPNVSNKLDKSLTDLMILRASLPNYESSDDSCSDTPSEGKTAGTITADNQTHEERTEESAPETDMSASRTSVGAGISESQHNCLLADKDEDSLSRSTPSSLGSQSSDSPVKKGALHPPNKESLPPSGDGMPKAAAATNVPQDIPVSSSVTNLHQQPIPAPLTHTPREILPLVLPVGDKIRVVVSEVVSPSIFWIQPVQSNIESLMEEIGVFYSTNTELPAIHPKVGMYCCACYTNDNCWYRARVIAIHLSPSSHLAGSGVEAMIDIMYIDYGNRERTPVSRLRPLNPRFMAYPAQAACCKLAKVRPTGKAGAYWSEEETDFFTQLTVSSHLTAVVIKQADTSSTLPATDLLFDRYINETETRQVDIGKFMIGRHKAIPEEQSAHDASEATDTSHTQRTHTTDSELCHSPNTAEGIHESNTATPKQRDINQNEAKHEADLQQNKETEAQSSGKKKKLKKRSKKGKRSHDPGLSTEDTDVPLDEVQKDAMKLAKEESTSDTPICESEYTREEREPSFCRTPETSCTETEDRSNRVLDRGKVATNVAIAAEQKVTSSPRHLPSGVPEHKRLDVGGKEEEHRMSCESGSTRSCSPNSTSGVSSAVSSMCVPSKSNDFKANPLYEAGKRDSSMMVSSIPSQKVCTKDIRERSFHVEMPRRSSQDSIGFAVASVDECSTEMTDQFFTCAEDGSEADSTERDNQHSNERRPMQSTTPAMRKPIIKEIGYKYVAQRLLRQGEVIQFAMSHIVSPQEFYIHLLTTDAKKMDFLMEELNRLYTDIEAAGAYERPLKWPVVRSTCCAKFVQDDQWYRGLVLEIKSGLDSQQKREILVQYVDFGNSEWIAEDRVYPLERYFCSLPAMTFKCVLARIHPPEGEGLSTDKNGKPDKWPEESVSGLVSSSGFEKRLSGRIIHGGGSSDCPAELEVLDDSSGEEVCLNQSMVDLGLASSSFYKKTNQVTAVTPEVQEGGDGVGNQDPQTQNPASKTEKAAIPEDWNPMVQHFSSDVNSYGVDMDDAGVATTGMKSTLERRVCKFYVAGKHCYRGLNCPYEHPKPGRERVEQTLAYWCDSLVGLPAVGQWVAVEVTSIHTPIHFWAQLPFGPKPLDQVQRECSASGTSLEEGKEDGETLSELLASINDIYKKPYTRHEDLSLLALGEIVCAQFTADDCWYRARVTDVNAESNKVQVFYVDYGDTEWLPRAKVRPAMPQFLHLPFQAVECFLSGVEFVPRSPPKDEGIDGARKLFEELTVDKALVAHVISSRGDTLFVELYDTKAREQVHIGKALAQAGYARLTKKDPEQGRLQGGKRHKFTKW